MAELMLKVGDGAGYLDGDVLLPFSRLRIRCVHAEHICDPNNFGHNADGLRQTGTVAEILQQETRSKKLEVVSKRELRVTDILSGDTKICSDPLFDIKIGAGPLESIKARLSKIALAEYVAKNFPTYKVKTKDGIFGVWDQTNNFIPHQLDCTTKEHIDLEAYVDRRKVRQRLRRIATTSPQQGIRCFALKGRGFWVRGPSDYNPIFIPRLSVRDEGSNIVYPFVEPPKFIPRNIIDPVDGVNLNYDRTLVYVSDLCPERTRIALCQKLFVFGTTNNELWYGGRTAVDHTVFNKVWSAIETNTDNVETNHQLHPMGLDDGRFHLWIRVDDMTPKEAAALSESEYDMTPEEEEAAIDTWTTGGKIGEQPSRTMTKKRKQKIDWQANLAFSADSKEKVLNKGVYVDKRMSSLHDRAIIVETKP